MRYGEFWWGQRVVGVGQKETQRSNEKSTRGKGEEKAMKKGQKTPNSVRFSSIFYPCPNASASAHQPNTQCPSSLPRHVCTARHNTCTRYRIRKTQQNKPHRSCTKSISSLSRLSQVVVSPFRRPRKNKNSKSLAVSDSLR